MRRNASLSFCTASTSSSGRHESSIPWGSGFAFHGTVSRVILGSRSAGCNTTLPGSGGEAASVALPRAGHVAAGSAPCCRNANNLSGVAINSSPSAATRLPPGGLSSVAQRNRIARGCNTAAGAWSKTIVDPAWARGPGRPPESPRPDPAASVGPALEHLALPGVDPPQRVAAGQQVALADAQQVYGVLGQMRSPTTARRCRRRAQRSTRCRSGRPAAMPR